jgi:hypothetical protein
MRCASLLHSLKGQALVSKAVVEHRNTLFHQIATKISVHVLGSCHGTATTCQNIIFAMLGSKFYCVDPFTADKGAFFFFIQEVPWHHAVTHAVHVQKVVENSMTLPSGT